MRRTTFSMFITGACLALASGCGPGVMTLSKEAYLDKCQGAWLGQMVGVSYGQPYEFNYTGQIMEDPIRPWNGKFLAAALSNDDLYVEMTWLNALTTHGLDVTYAQAGKAFAETKFGVAHANRSGRENVRSGIMPPLSGHPDNTRHADDIDFQIEADALGIICPGMPRESNRLCDIFGHIMCYGDGVYGGMFVAGMYAAAYFESDDVEKVVELGLACIPAGSLYHQCIRDTIDGYHENPDNWRATWQRLEDKWQDDIDCVPGSPFNIDAKINGAYIALGLLYGQGDIARTLEIATRCGQDNDCNPSNAFGVLGCMKGVSNLPPEYTAGLQDIQDKTFADSNLTFREVIATCKSLTERLIVRNGGRVTDDAYHIAVQRPEPAPLKQWENQMTSLVIAIPQEDIDRWLPRWKVIECGHEMGPGYIDNFAGRDYVLLIVPRRDGPAIIEGKVEVPSDTNGFMTVPVSSFGSNDHWIGDFRLKIFINDKLVRDKVICTLGRFAEETIDVSAWRDQTITVRIEAHQHESYHWERAYIGRVQVN